MGHVFAVRTPWSQSGQQNTLNEMGHSPYNGGLEGLGGRRWQWKPSIQWKAVVLGDDVKRLGEALVAVCLGTGPSED